MVFRCEFKNLHNCIALDIVSSQNGKIQFNSYDQAVNISKHCLHLTTDNNETISQLFTCDEYSPEKQLHKSLFRIIGETNCVDYNFHESGSCQKGKCRVGRRIFGIMKVKFSNEISFLRYLVFFPTLGGCEK